MEFVGTFDLKIGAGTGSLILNWIDTYFSLFFYKRLLQCDRTEPKLPVNSSFAFLIMFHVPYYKLLLVE